MKRGSTVRTIMTVMVVLLVLLASAQAHATQTWLKTYANAGSTLGGSLVQTRDNGYLQLGMSTGVGLGSWDILAIKLDRTGTIQWQKAFGGVNYDKADSVLQAVDGGYVISGYVDEQAWTSRAWVAKLDEQGDLLWQKEYPFAGRASRVAALRQTADNGYIMQVFLITPAYYSDYMQYDIWLVKLDAAGAIEWQKLFNLAQFDMPGTVKQTADGGYIMTGTSANNVWVVRLDSTGTPLWQKTYDHSVSEMATDLVLTPDGGCVVSGYTRALSPYDNYWWALKLDENGGIQWQKRYNVEHNPNFPVGIVATADNGYMLSGGFSIPTMVKLDANGTIQWAKRVGSYLGIYAQTLLQEPDGGYIMSSSLSYYGNYGFSIAKLDENGNLFGDNYSCGYYVTPQSPSSADVSFVVTDTHVAGVATDKVPVEGTMQTAIPAVSEVTVCATSAPDISVSPASLSLGRVDLPGSVAGTITISNIGTASLRISSISIDGANASEFGQSSFCTSIAPNASCTVAVRFNPVSAGEKTATLRIASDDPDTPSAGVALSGIAVARIPPATTINIIGAKNSNDWYQSRVTMNLIATNGSSGVRDIRYSVDGNGTVVAGGSASFTIIADGTHEISYYATDNAGIAETAHTVSIKIDQTPPTITALVSPAPNATGWNTTDATVTFSCSDTLSGTVSCPSPVTVTTEGAGQVISGSVVDMAGNAATAAVVVNIDRTAPAVSISANPALLWPPNHKMVDVTITGSAADSGSGTASIVFTIVDEYGIVQPAIAGFNTTIQLQATRKGTDKDGRFYTITAIATDKAGNQTSASTTVLVPHDRGDDDRDRDKKDHDKRDGDRDHDHQDHEERND